MFQTSSSFHHSAYPQFQGRPSPPEKTHLQELVKEHFNSSNTVKTKNTTVRRATSLLGQILERIHNLFLMIVSAMKSGFAIGVAQKNNKPHNPTTIVHELEYYPTIEKAQKSLARDLKLFSFFYKSANIQKTTDKEARSISGSVKTSVLGENMFSRFKLLPLPNGQAAVFAENIIKTGPQNKPFI